MALFNQLSPGVATSEFDTTTSTPEVSTSIGAIVGDFNWGPVLQIQTVSNPNGAAGQPGSLQLFGYPDNNTAISFFTAWNFLQYTDNLATVRALGSNTINATSNANGQLIMNGDDYFNNVYATRVTNAWTARYPGALGNGLEVVVFANATSWATAAANVNDPLYAFANQFPYAPGTSPSVTTQTNGNLTGDGLHALVVDSSGNITGTANSILEVWPNLSRLTDSLAADGTSNYYVEFFWQNSLWVYNTGTPQANTVGWDVTIAAANSTGCKSDAAEANNQFLSGGKDGTVIAANTVVAQELFLDADSVDIDLFMVGGGQQVETDNAIAIASQRKDIVVFGSPPLANVQNQSVGQAVAINNYANGLTRSTYAVIDSGWKYQYDQFNGIYRWIPLNGDIAGLCARTDNVRAPWWSPAGLQRGQILNVIKLAFNPKKTDRDALYSNGVNPVVSFPGQGTLLWGDKTFVNFDTVFDRINVRRLFIVLEKTISQAAQSSLFEFNDSFTQASFVNLVSPFLRTVQGQRGIKNYFVVCDSTNNTPAVVQNNQFVGDIYIQPNYSINYIQLNFVAVGQGVQFSTVVGQFGGQ